MTGRSAGRSILARRLAPAVLLTLFVPPAGARAAASTAHLEWARRLIDGVTPETNVLR